MSKGSTRRPAQVTDEEIRKHWEETFKTYEDAERFMARVEASRHATGITDEGIAEAAKSIGWEDDE